MTIDTTNLATFRIVDDSVVDIGAQGDARQILFRIAGALRLSNGVIAIANSGSFQVLYFDPSGRFLRAVGRQGEGPGEFKLIRTFSRLHGDQLGVFDSHLFRITILTGDGSIVRTISTQSGPVDQLGPTYASPLGILVQVTGIEEAHSQPSGVYRAGPRHFVIWDGVGRRAVNIGPLPGPEMIMGTLVPFGYRFFFALGENVIYEGAGKPGEVARFTYDGGILSSFRINRSSEPVSQADYDEAVRASAALSGPGGSAGVTKLLSGVTHPDVKPVYTDLAADPQGNLWIRMTAGSDAGTNEWWVVNPSGQRVARVSLPAQDKVLDVSLTGVLLRHLDDMDLEHVLYYPLRRT